MSVSSEEFADWQQHPVTEYVVGLMRRWAERQQAEWGAQAWDAENIDPLFLKEAKTRADCYRTIPDSTLEDWQSIEEKLDDTKS